MLKFCSEPWDTISIFKNGNVYPCLCPGWHTTPQLIGNIIDSPLQDIFSSAKVDHFRSKIIDQSFEFCNKFECSKRHNLSQVDNFDFINNYPKLPTTFNLLIDNNCNLKCASCRTKNIYSTEINPTVKKILDNLVTAYQNFDQRVLIFCDGTGDIFASSAYQEFFRRDDLPECFKFCLQTNGNLVTKNMDILEKIKHQIDIVIVSFDASCSKTYKTIRGGNFDIVLDGVAQMIKLGIKVSTQFVIQYENYLEILDYVNLCKTLGVSGNIGLQKIDRWGHMSDSWWNANQLDNNPTIDYDFLINALKELKQDPQCNICGGLENLIATSTSN
jgi:MoaA/NifB/PqqE/SkfB family radical SAM enzyme